MHNLTIIPSVPVWFKEDRIIFDRKFYDGIIAYINFWPGSITCVMSYSTGTQPSFGLVEKKKIELPFDIQILPSGSKVDYKNIKDASIVLASGDAHNQFHLAKICKKNKIKCVYVIEYTPETRLEINSFEAPNSLIRMYRFFYILIGEIKRKAAFKIAEGIQANGDPAFNKYGHLTKSIKYYDTRVNKNEIITDLELNKRLDRLSNKKNLTLAFSGRLIAIKGVDQLIDLALILKNNKLTFKILIYGSGNLETYLKRKIITMQLKNEIEMIGAVDFKNQLLPDLKENIDLFIMLHKQSDPSCTYLETLSCGIPIVGYENEAFKGLLSETDIGWGKPIGKIEGIANIIFELNKDREQIKQKSINSVKFARKNDFETTFKKRVNQLLEICNTM